MELTKEYFDEQLVGIATRLDGMATKEDLKEVVKPLATKDELAQVVKPLATKDELAQVVKPLVTKEGLKENFEELARMTADGFLEMTHQFAETAKQRDLEALGRELNTVRSVIDRIFNQIDRNAQMPARHEEELVQLRARVDKLEAAFRKFNLQGI